MAVIDQGRRERIAGKLRAHRAESGMSQAKAAERVGSEKDAIGRYERGVASPSIETMWDMADMYGVSLDELVGREFTARGGDLADEAGAV